MDQMLEAFIGEARENLETAGSCFLTLEKNPADDPVMNDLFRAIHTIKGSSGLFDLPAFTKVVHAAEDVLDQARSGELSLSSEHIDLFLDTMDQIGIWLDDLERAEQLGEGCEEIGLELTQSLRELLGETDIASAQESTETFAPEAEGALTEAPVWTLLIPESHRISLFNDAMNAEGQVLGVEYCPDEQSFFSGEDPLHTVRNLPGLVWFMVRAKNPWPQKEEFDPYLSNIVFCAVTNSKVSDIQHYMRYVSEQVQISAFDANALVLPSGEFGDSEPYIAFIPEAQKAIEAHDWETLQKCITPLLQFSGPDLLQTSALSWMAVLLEQQTPPVALLKALLDVLRTGDFIQPEGVEVGEQASSIDTEQLDSVSAEDPLATSSWRDNPAHFEAVRNIIATQKQILKLPCAVELLAGRIASTALTLKNLLFSIQHDTQLLDDAEQLAKSQQSLDPLQQFITDIISYIQLRTATDTAPDVATDVATNIDTEPVIAGEISPSAPVDEEKRGGGDRRKGDRRQKSRQEEPAQSADQHKVIKVDQQRIDALMDLVGELIVAKNALPFLAKRAEDDFGIRVLSKEIQTHYAVINRLSEELQSAMMQIRMVPISTVFQRFPRLVRDLSRKLDKKISLILEGEETEADKNVVENLSDPLIHLVRNSIDHGLENVAERKVAGKPTVGSITLRAIPHDDQVVIEIIDDGHGIDPEVIKRKAYERGIIDESRLDSISDHEALQLIFAAGLSTAQQVSDLSGRGVGMDVVRSVINNAGGTVVVESIVGQGTTVRLVLPLSMAVSQVMMIETSEQIYGISMGDIVETVRIPATKIRRIKQREAVVLRDRVVPLFHLRQLLKLPAVESLPEEVAVLIVNLGGQAVGLIIDEFHEGIDIIQKPLEGIMANYSIYSGAALLGDGRVLLVLDLQELLSCR